MKAFVQKLSAVQEAVVITTIFAGWFILTATLMVFSGFPAGGSFDDAGAMSLIVFEFVTFCIAATVLHWRGWKVRDFAFSITWRHALIGLVLLAAVYLADIVLWEVAGRRLDGGALLNEMSESMRVSVGMAVVFSVVNGAFEEFFLCRYLIERFRHSGAAFAVTLSACIRMLYHTYQGPTGTLSILAFGLILGVYYWRTRALGAVVVTHFLADVLALTQ